MRHVTVHVTWCSHGNHIFTDMFFKISISLCLKIKQKLSCSLFMSLDHFMMFLFLLVTFESILENEENQKSKMVDKDGHHSEMVMQLLRHVKSYLHNADVKGDIIDILCILQVPLS